jgi:MFS family permease
MNENTSRAGRREWIGLAVLTLPALLVTMDLSVLFRSLSLIRSLFPEEQRRTVAIGVWMSAFAAGAAVGPLVGGALLEQFWWGVRVPAERSADRRDSDGRGRGGGGAGPAPPRGTA